MKFSTKSARLSLSCLLLLFAFLFSGAFNHLRSQTLVWEENFNSSAVNPHRWTYDFGDGCERALCGWGNSELEYYTSRPENVRIENGNLVIEARKENFANSAFTSGRIKTEGRVHFKYGTVEARIKLPNVTKGLWPAFWTLGTIGPSWPSIGEIDMMEVGSGQALQDGVGNKRVSSATHWSNASGAHEYATAFTDAPVDLSLDYHLYKMVWTSDFIKMYVDDVNFYTFDISGGAAANLSEFHNPHFLLLNLAVGGAYVNIYDPNGITAPLPGKMLVDYIKLYQNPGDELFIGDEHASAGNFGILTETTPVTNSLSYGINADLYYWNNLVNITSPAPVPFEGNSLLAVHAAANDWFGMGIANNYINLNNYATGSLQLNFKTTYTGQFKMGIKTGHGKSWINFAAGTQKYGMVRDGNWHQVTIPIADFNNPNAGMNIDLYSVKGAFMFAGDPATSNADFYLDNIYFSGGISPNPSPLVSITSPANNSIVVTPADVVINADASDPNGSVVKVDFYSGATLLGTNSTAPYTFTIVNPQPKVDTLIAKATDNEGAIATSTPVIVFVSAPGNTAPEVSISSPADGASFLTPANIVIDANATDDVNGGIYKVEFYTGDTLLATDVSAPYSFTWTGAKAGNYHLTAKATDIGGLTAISSPVQIFMADPIKPTVAITSPADNSSFTPPATINITANAADENGTVTKVEFYAGTSLLATDSVAPYATTWSNVPYGNYIVTAKATDNDGNFTVSAPVNINVAPVACTGTAVSGDYSYEVYTAGNSVYFRFHPLQPIAGSSSAIIYLKLGSGSGTYPGYGMMASGADFIFSKAIVNGTPTSFYFSYNVPAGGERNSSTDPHSYVVGTVCVTGAPTVSITSPAENATFTSPANITIKATAADADGTISKVEFYNDSLLLGSTDTLPYSYTWNNVAAGSYTLVARAIDNTNKATNSIPVHIIVNEPNTDGYCGTAVNKDYEYKAETAGGIVTFTFHPLAPITGCTYALIYVREGTAGGYPGYGMTASGSDFIFTKAIADGTPLSFYFTYNVPSGGERNSSANPHSYTVGDNCTGLTGTPPSISITSPVNNATFTEPAAITIEATTSDSDGTVTKVDFYNGANYLGSDSTLPFAFTWTNVPAGNYTITAKATDNSGLSTISTSVKIVVNIDNSNGFCGSVENGDYNYNMSTSGGMVNFQFHPLDPIAGCSYVYIYVREGTSGGYPGYPMVQVGTDFTFSKAIANGTQLSVYFTYNVPAGGERNSSATPHSYTVGTVCSGSLPVIPHQFYRQSACQW